MNMVGPGHDATKPRPADLYAAAVEVNQPFSNELKIIERAGMSESPLLTRPNVPTLAKTTYPLADRWAKGAAIALKNV